MSSPYGSQDSFTVGLCEEPDPFESSQTEGTEVVQGGVTSGVARHNPVEPQLQPEKLGFCRFPDWDEEKAYDEDGTVQCIASRGPCS